MISQFVFSPSVHWYYELSCYTHAPSPYPITSNHSVSNQGSVEATAHTMYHLWINGFRHLSVNINFTPPVLLLWMLEVVQYVEVIWEIKYTHTILIEKSYGQSNFRLISLTISQLLTNLPKCYATRKFITMFTKAMNWVQSWDRLIQPIPPQPTSLRFMVILFSHLCLRFLNCLFPSGFPSRRRRLWEDLYYNDWSIIVRPVLS
jgi:hypothetical protein